MTNSCKVIQDLLPLYVDNVTSNESNLLVINHLDECENCNQMYHDMKNDMSISSHNVEELPEYNLKQLINRIKKRKIINAGSILVIFSILGFLLGGYLFYANNFIINRVQPIPLTFENRNTYDNPAEKVNLESSILKSYQVNHKDVMPGYYDIAAVEGNVDIGGIHLSEGQQYVGKQFYSNNLISVRGNGYAQLVPAKFQKETMNNNTYKFHNKFGKYQAGIEIEPGTYEIQVLNDLETPFYVFTTIDNFSEDSLNKRSIDIKDSKVHTFSVKKGEFINISNWSKEETDITVKLTKISD
ncbi:zf-HC2 domain-containing protein [Virgibacillus doumboii]|uniref:zf-HC2 domain-containing protein n=1 Tax=Virgibacillus doumboii TaxID=2697503 RepID=UPI0013DEDE89|nr:zf-HC2 domain-containing protein [Virgibacillus doumboii]